MCITAGIFAYCSSYVLNGGLGVPGNCQGSFWLQLFSAGAIPRFAHVLAADRTKVYTRNFGNAVWKRPEMSSLDFYVAQSIVGYAL